MTNNKKRLFGAAVAGIMGAVALVSTGFAADKKKNDMAKADTEKCYGVNKCKGTADCGGKGRSCKGSNACNSAMVPDAFIVLPKGVCERLENGSLAPLPAKG